MKPSVKYALVTSIGVILWSLIMFLTELDRSDSARYLNYVSYLIMLIFLILAMNEQKQLNGGFISYGEAFKTGFILVLITSVIITIYTYLYMTVISPDFIEFIKEKSRADMEMQQGMTTEQVDQAMSIAEKFMSPTVITVFAFLGNLFFGTILSLIVAAFIKKEKPMFEENI